MQIICKHSPHWPMAILETAWAAMRAAGESSHPKPAPGAQDPKTGLDRAPGGIIQGTPGHPRILTSENPFQFLRSCVSCQGQSSLALSRTPSCLRAALGLLRTTLTSLHRPLRSSKSFHCWTLKLLHLPAFCPSQIHKVSLTRYTLSTRSMALSGR